MTAILYQYELSPFCDKVRRALNLKGIAYRTEEISLLDTLRGRLKQLSPAAKVPVLVIDGETLSDSTDIIHWLEARYPEPRLTPANTKEQALVHFLEDWADESLYFHEMHLRFTLPHNARRWVAEVTAHDNTIIKHIAKVAVPLTMRKTTEAQGTGRKPLAALLRDLDRHLLMLEQWLDGREWLVGDRLTLADLAVYAQLFCIAGALEGQDLLQRHAGVQAWMTRVDRASRQRVA